MKNKALTEVIDYIIDHEVNDFIENIEDQNITPYERRMIFDWFNDDIGTTNEVKEIFRKIVRSGNGHIYASAICLWYDIEV